MSKIITITLGDDMDDIPDREGWVIVGYSDARGGRTDIGVMIREDAAGNLPTWGRVAELLHGNMGRNEWPEFIRSQQSGNRVRLSVPDELDHTMFSAQFNPSLDQTMPHEANPRFVAIEDDKF